MGIVFSFLATLVGGSWRRMREPSSPHRSQWVDVARGLCIALVVFGHALQGSHPGLAGAPSWMTQLYVSTLPARMPLFFMLSGLFIWPSVAKGRRRFLQSRWWNVVYPYLLWSALTVMLKLALDNYVNSPLSWRNLLLIPVVPVEQFWFLYTLFVLQMMALVAFRSQIRLWCLIISGLAALTLLGGEWIGLRAFLSAPFVALGIGLVKVLMQLSTFGWQRQTAIMILAGSAYSVLVLTAPFVWPQLSRWLLGFTGSIALIVMAMLLARFRLFEPLARCGHASLVIFTLHTIFSAGARITLGVLGWEASVPLTFAAGILGPFIVWHWSLGRSFARWFGLGEHHQRSPRDASTSGILVDRI